VAVSESAEVPEVRAYDLPHRVGVYESPMSEERADETQGSSKGAQMTISDKLLAKADEYHQRAEALRLAAAELLGVKTETKKAKLADTLAGAIELRAQQRPSSSNGHHKHRVVRDRGGDQTEGRRKVLLGVLKRGPQQIKTLTIALNDAGYLIQRDRVRQFLVDHVPEVHCEGTAAKARWVLGTSGKKTAAPSNGKKRKNPTRTVDVRAQRERSAKWLAHYNTTTPVPTYPKGMPSGTIGVYVRRGYLKRTDNGYVRTAKVFAVDQK
jgi:hypothetical protein